MSRVLTCPKGHQWDAGDAPAPDREHPILCPVCGAQPETIVAHAPQTPDVCEGQLLPAELVEGPDDRDRPTVLAGGADAGPGAVGWPTVPGYEILGILGRGGMGVVYKARQISLDRVVALKMVLAGAHAGPQELGRFRTEAEAVARLQHPNIVQIYEVGEQEGRPYFSLEYVDGGSLAQKLDKAPLPPREAAGVIEMLARAIDAAHRANIVHRDLKPGNVLLTRDGVPKITDFGLAKRLDSARSQTKTGSVLGTPCYMAPEQAGGKIRQIGPATDIYALGAMLYEMLTCRPPFQADTDLDTLMKVVAEEPVPPRSLQPRVPRDLELICLRCLQKDPARRYGSARELADELHRFLSGEPIQTRPIGVVERLVRWTRRRRETVLILVGALAAACLGLLAVGVWHWSRGPDKDEPPPGPNHLRPEKPARLAPLPADLALVPPDAFGFATVRFGDLVNAEAVKRMQQRIYKEFPAGKALLARAIADREKELGLHLKDVERATLVYLEPPALTVTGNGWTVIVATRRPHDAGQIRKALGAQLARRTPDGKTYYVARQPDRPAVHFVSDRVLVLGFPSTTDPRGPGKPFEEFLARMGAPSGPPVSGPLRGALERAARKHLVVLGVNPPPALLRSLDQLLAGWSAKLGPLFALRTGSVTLDLQSTLEPQPNGDTLLLNLTLTFPDQAAAVQGRKAVRAGLELVQEGMRHGITELRRMVAHMERELSGTLELSAQLLNQFEFALRTAKVHQEKNQVRVELNVVTDLAAIGVAQAQFLANIRKLSARMDNANKLRQIALAMLNYHAVNGHFPPAVIRDRDGRPLYSWRVALLPYLDQGALYKEFRADEPWDGAHNRKLLAKIPEVYVPVGSRAPPHPVLTSLQVAATSYVAPALTQILNPQRFGTYFQVFVGPQAPFGDDRRPRVPDSFKDGAGQTFLVVEGGQLVPWTKPADIAYDDKKPVPRLGGRSADGFYAAMADGSVGFVPRGMSAQTLRAAITPAAGDRLGKDWFELRKDAHPAPAPPPKR